MVSARSIKKNIKTRTFISKRYTIENKYSYGPARFGLAYGDVRSHQKRRHVTSGVGILALITLPEDTLHLLIKEHKKRNSRG